MERISREECIKVYKIETIFFNQLMEAGLIETTLENNTVYLAYERLSKLEKLINWHYDLDINVPGLEVIHHLLHKIETLQTENNVLLQKIARDIELNEEY